MKKLYVLSFVFFLSFCSKPNAIDPNISAETIPPITEVTDSSCEQAVSNWSEVFFIDVEAESEYLMHSNTSIKGHVISSDLEGAVYKALYIQELQHPFRTLKLLVESTDNSLKYPRGSEIVIDISLLRSKRKNAEITLGAYDESFSNPTLAPLLAAELADRVALCESSTPLIALPIAENATLDTIFPNRLIVLDELMFSQSYTEVPFGSNGEATIHQLENCLGQSWRIESSGYEQFIDELTPAGSGSITGRYIPGSTPAIGLDIWTDLQFDQPRCEPENFDNAAIFISELADPDNEIGARFVELYNAENTAVSLIGWSLVRYTNEAIEPSHVYDLSAFEIAAHSAFVIASNQEVFTSVYGQEPDAVSTSGSAAHSNGDDNIALVNAAGELVDLFGVIGEDGSGTNHEFEDGRALRKPAILRGQGNYDVDGWMIWNDTGESGTQKEVQRAPEHFNPGIHETAIENSRLQQTS